MEDREAGKGSLDLWCFRGDSMVRDPAISKSGLPAKVSGAASTSRPLTKR